MSLAGMEFKYSTLASICELFAGHDLIKGRGITVYFGKMPENWSAGLPVIRMVPTSDTYERGGLGKAVDSALPMKPGAPSELVTASAIWTRGAGFDLVLYPSAIQNIEELISLSALALEDIEGVSGNYQIESGHHELRDLYQTESDCYVMNCRIIEPIYKLQRRTIAGGIDITTTPRGLP